MELIPQLHFRKRSELPVDMEILSLQELYKKQSQLSHRLDRPHRIEFYSVIFVTEGSGNHYIDFQSYAFEPGTLIFISKGQVHSFSSLSEMKGIQLLFSADYLEKYFLDSHSLFSLLFLDHDFTSPVLLPEQDRFEKLMGILEDLHREYRSPGDGSKEEILACLLKYLLLKIKGLMVCKNPDDSISNARKIFIRFNDAVGKHHTETRNVTDYARLLSLSYKDLNAACSQCVSSTAKQFIDQQIVLEIKRQLAVTNHSIKELTYHMGFDEVTNFVKFFKKHTGKTPSQFRQVIT